MAEQNKNDLEESRIVDTRAAVLLKEVEARSRMMELQASKSASDLAAEHLSVWAGLYMTLMVCLFLFSCLFLEPEVTASLCGLITLVVTSLAGIMRSIVGDPAQRDKEKNGDNGGGADK
jgi:uncharacterized membrane protein|tara:strand:- start:8368 stop:8724 length:357 start_codon:yes stop_codon:yes gene_type:complete